MMHKTENGSLSEEALRHAFRLLTTLELGSPSAWDESISLPELYARVSSLMTLSNIVPRTEAHRISVVLEAWRDVSTDAGQLSHALLRDTARQALNVSERQISRVDQYTNSLERAIRLTQVGDTKTEQSASQKLATRWTEAEAQQCCVQGLKLWFDQLDDGYRWTYLPAVVPGEAAAPFTEVYVDLYAIPDEELTDQDRLDSEGGPRLKSRPRAGQFPVVSGLAMVSRTLERCIIVGEPGSGKSTLIHWLAWSAHRGHLPDYDVPLVVKLSAFARELEETPDISLLEFFFQSLGTEVKEWRAAAAAGLRRVATANRRFLLLLDGWDEVPAALRDLVRERMAAEERLFTTVVTSRPSGMPKQLRPGTRVDYYHLAGLTEAAQAKLVKNLLTRLGLSDRQPAIFRRMRDEPDLLDMSENPFLLGLLVRVLVQNLDKETAPRTRAEVYQQLMAWLREQHNSAVGHDHPLQHSHFVGLRQLAYFLLFEEQPPKYVFREADLAGRLPDGADVAVLRSRLVNRLDTLFDEHAFVHATFQEFFAAEQAAAAEPAALEKLLDRTFYSSSRLIVLEFLAGLGGKAGERCRERAVQWLQDCDRFHQVVLRVARLSAAGRWSHSTTPEVDQSIRDELWRILSTESDLTLTQNAVEAFANLDAGELCRRARQEATISSWVINCLIETVPVSIAKTEGIDQLLEGNWQDYAGFDVRGGATQAELTEIRAALGDPTRTQEDVREAMDRAGGARDEGAVPLVLRWLDNAQTPEATRNEAINSLGLIGGREAHDALVRIVLGEWEATPAESRFAAAKLRHLPGSRRLLEPAGRDQLIRRLAVIPAYDPRVEAILAALEGFPIRDGSRVIATIAGELGLDSQVRARAVAVLDSIPDRQLAREIVDTIADETSWDVVAQLLHLAVARALAVPGAWLSEKITHCRDRVQLHRLMKSLILLWPYLNSADQEHTRQFLHRLVLKSLQDNLPQGDDRSKALVQALSLATPGPRPCLREETLSLAQVVLARFAEFPQEVSEGNVLLATAVINQFQRPSLQLSVQAALDMALDRLRLGEERGQAAERMAQALAQCLGNIAPVELLRYPQDGEVVQSVLRSFAIERGWLVFRHRMTDAEGTEIAGRKVEVVTVRSGTFPPEIQRILERLTPALQATLSSYLRMVMPGGPCRADNQQDVIYQAILARHNGEIADELSAEIDAWFPNSLPTLQSWRSNLNRIERVVRDQTADRDVLRHYGLFRRTRRTRKQ